MQKFTWIIAQDAWEEFFFFFFPFQFQYLPGLIYIILSFEPHLLSDKWSTSKNTLLSLASSKK